MAQMTRPGLIVQNRPDPALQARFDEMCDVGYRLGVLGTEVLLRTNRPAWLDLVGRFFPESPLEAQVGDASLMAPTFYFVHDRDASHPYRVMNPSGRYAASDRWQAVLPFLISTTYAHIWSAADDLLPLHSACVAQGDRAILFPATSGGGKTTLVLELTKRGLTYLSDEFAPLCLGSRRVGAVPRPLQVSAEAVQALMGSFAPSILAQEGIRDDQGELRYLVEPGNPGSMEQRYEIRAIVAPVLRPGTGPRAGAGLAGTWEPWSKVEALALLASSALVYGHDMGWRERAVSTLVDVVRAASCYRLYLGPMGQNGSLVEELLAQDRGNVAETGRDTQTIDDRTALDQVAWRIRQLLATDPNLDDSSDREDEDG